jgi:hypothetical protein
MDIDTLSAELTRELTFDSIEKALPPKIAYRFQAWMRRMRQRAGVRQMGVNKFEQMVFDKFQELQDMQQLAKNEARASFFDSGIIKMDFGSEVNLKAKEAALQWAKKRGLKVAEASLVKSADNISSYTFAQAQLPAIEGSCVKRMKWCC